MELAPAPLLAPDRLDRPFTDPLVARLFPERPTGVQWGLERTQRALQALGDPQDSFEAIHVGGTNGKGSVTATVASVLRASGHRAGAYTSPHLCSFRERILVNGEPIPEERLLRYGDEVRDSVVRFGLTFFEAATVLGFYAFREEGVDVAAVEVGLGGRLDATNVLRPALTAVTNVAMDHAEYLGTTVSAIAIEKAGIMKPDVPFLTAEVDPEVLALFRAEGRGVGAPVSEIGGGAVADAAVTREGTTFRMATAAWGELEVVTPLVGRHQAANAALAIGLCERLPDSLRPAASDLLAGIRSVRHRGRDDIRVIDGRTWVFDVAHNTAGVESLADTIGRLDLPRPVVALVGVLGDKDWKSMLPPLLTMADEAVLTLPESAPSDRRWDPSAAARDVGGGAAVSVVEDFRSALVDASERSGKGTVVVTGSVHTVGNAMSFLALDPLT